jgi:peptide/nickel transport system ATP-binding protein
MSGRDVSLVLDVVGLEVEFVGRDGTCLRPVRGVDLQLSAGQRLGLVGESGSGKSLTALALMRLIRPPGYVHAERIVLQGRSLVELSADDAAPLRGAVISMIYQNPMSALNPVLTIGAQLVEALRVHEPVSRAIARRRAADILREVGFSDADQRMHDYPHQFSGGMRQRAMIAMALIAGPAVVIADECTTAVDNTTQARIVDCLRRMVSERGAAVIFITHDLELASDFCSDLIVMYAGRAVESGPIDLLYGTTSHPYSQLLQSSICRLDTDPTKPLAGIEGTPPKPGAVVSGCPFAARCARVMPICLETEPELTATLQRADHRTACHFVAMEHAPVPV